MIIFTLIILTFTGVCCEDNFATFVEDLFKGEEAGEAAEMILLLSSGEDTTYEEYGLSELKKEAEEFVTNLRLVSTKLF